MKQLIYALIVTVAVALCPAPSFAQTNPSFTTTLSTAITATQTTITLAAVTSSLTGAVSPLAPGMGLYIDGEYLLVAGSYVSGLQVQVIRGQLGTTAKAHVTSSPVIVGPAAMFSTTDPGAGSSTCPSTPAPYLAQVNVVTGNVWLCRWISGFSGSRVWWATNSRGITYNSITVR